MSGPSASKGWAAIHRTLAGSEWINPNTVRRTRSAALMAYADQCGSEFAAAMIKAGRVRFGRVVTGVAA